MRRFYVYALFDSAEPREIRYVGGDYGSERRKQPREFDHKAMSGAKCTRPWIRELEAAGRTVGRRKLVICSESAMYDGRMEQRVWDAYKSAGHRLLNDRPMAWPKGASAARDARRTADPEFDARWRLGCARGDKSIGGRAGGPKAFRVVAERRKEDPEFDAYIRSANARGGRHRWNRV